MKVTLVIVPLYYIIKIASCSDEKDKIPPLDDDLTLVSREVERFKTLLELCAEIESSNKKENEDKQEGEDIEKMDTTASEGFTTPESSPSKRPGGTIDASQSPKKEKKKYEPKEDLMYIVKPNLTIRVRANTNEKDQRLFVRRQRRLYSNSAFRKRNYDNKSQDEIPFKNRDLRSSPTRERRQRVYEYDQKDDDDDPKEDQIEQLTEDLSKTTLEEDTLDVNNNNDPEVVNLLDIINQEEKESKDKETGENNENSESKEKEEESADVQNETEHETGEVELPSYYDPNHPYKREK